MQRILGRSDIVVSAVGLSCWVIGGPMWAGKTLFGKREVNDNASIRALQYAIDNGITFFDTADVYGAGHSERILGQVINPIRDKVVVATKFGKCFDEDTRQITGTSTDPEYIIRACEASLKRLQTDYIDLYQFHVNDCAPHTAVVIREVLEKLVETGKIRHYAWSTNYVDRARVFEAGKHNTAVQHAYNVFYDNSEMLKFTTIHNLASISRNPLAMSLLAGKYDAHCPLFHASEKTPGTSGPTQYFQDGEPTAQWLKKLTAIKRILKSEGRTSIQGAIAWLWGRNMNTIPLPTFRTVDQVKKLVQSMEFGPLDPIYMETIDKILGRYETDTFV